MPAPPPLRLALANAPPSPTPQTLQAGGDTVDSEIEAILKDADKDGDGHIDYNEFVELMSAWGARGREAA